jgi:uncharacterized membrane protein
MTTVSWFDRNRHWILLALVAVTTVLAVSTVGIGLLAVLAGLAGGAGLGAVLGDAALTLLIAAALVAADIAFAIAFLVTVTRRVSVPSLPSLPENERLSNAFARAEGVVPPLARLGLSDRFALSAETRRERLKQRYVDDELTQFEYERRLDELLADEEGGDVDSTTVDNLDAELAAGRRADADEAVSDESGPERTGERTPRRRQTERN